MPVPKAELQHRLATPRMTRNARAHGETAQAFGLQIEADVPLPGLRAPAVPADRSLRLTLATRESILERWRDEEAERLVTLGLPEAEATTIIDHQPELGYLFRSSPFGLFLLSPDGRRVTCAPDRPRTLWFWQSFITGQVLPAAALLQGLEVMHASAVEIAGGAVAFHGVSGAGKTSVALSLALRGAALIADDVLAVEAGEGGPIAHPGAPVVNLLDDERERLGEPNVRRLGRSLGHGDSISRIAIRRAATGPVPLRCLYRLDRGDHGLDDVEIVPEPAPSLQALIDLTFNTVFRSPQRRLTQLDVCSALIRATHVYTIRVPRSVDAGALAAQVERHVLGAIS